MTLDVENLAILQNAFAFADKQNRRERHAESSDSD
jgi:hypothetical protein